MSCNREAFFDGIKKALLWKPILLSEGKFLPSGRNREPLRLHSGGCCGKICMENVQLAGVPFD